MPHPKVKIADNSGNEVAVTSNALDVNIASGTADIDIGDVSLLLDGTAADYGTGNVNTSGRTLRVTLASDDVHFGAVGAASDSDGNIHGQLRYIGQQGINAVDKLTTIDVDTGNIATYTGYPLKNLGSDTYTEGSEWSHAIAAVRIDTLDALADTNNEFAPLQVNASGALYVDVADGGQLDTIIDTLETTLTAIETDQAAIEALLTTIDSDTGNLVDLGGTVGTHDTTGPSKVLSIGGTTGLGVIKEIAVDNDGQLQVDITSIAAGDNNIGNVDIVTLPASTNTIEVVGDAAEDAAVAGNPVLVGGRYDSSARSLDNGDAGAIALDNTGKVLISAANWLMVDGGAVTSPVHLGTESYSVSDSGMTSMAVMKDVLAAGSGITNGRYSPLAVDEDGALYTTHGVTGMKSGNNEGVDDTTAEVLKANTACKRVDMQADPSNTGYIYVGGSDVSAVKGIRLAPGDFYSIDCNNTADIYVLASVDEEDIHFTYYT